MSSRDEKSLSDQNTLSGGTDRKDSSQSLGDQPTFSGGIGHDPQSLGDEATHGDRRSTDESIADDGIEVVDLATRQIFMKDGQIAGEGIFPGNKMVKA